MKMMIALNQKRNNIEIMIERIDMKTSSSRMRSQTESPDVRTVPYKTCLCQDRPRRNVLKSRFSCVQNYLCVLRAFKRPYDQTFVRSKPKFVRSKFENLCVDVQIIVRSKTPMPTLSCVHVHTYCQFYSY